LTKPKAYRGINTNAQVENTMLKQNEAVTTYRVKKNQHQPPSQHDIPRRTFKDTNKYKKMVRDVQDELARRNIHLKTTTKEITKKINSTPACSISKNTVDRFLNYGRGGKYMFYVYGPYMTTTCAIADAMGMEFVLRPKSN